MTHFCYFKGTGKTYTGIKLVYLFMEINKQLRQNGGEHKQVVFCGPSNKSVDLVARRFYSPYIENHNILILSDEDSFDLFCLVTYKYKCL